MHYHGLESRLVRCTCHRGAFALTTRAPSYFASGVLLLLDPCL